MIEEFIIKGFPIRFDTSNKEVFSPHPVSILIANALEAKPSMSVLDVGTGSGILAIAAAKLHATRVVAIDLYSGALDVARRNACLNGVEDRIEWVCGNLLEPVKDERFDLIVSNPPCMPLTSSSDIPNAGFRHAVDGRDDGA